MFIYWMYKLIYKLKLSVNTAQEDNEIAHRWICATVLLSIEFLCFQETNLTKTYDQYTKRKSFFIS